MHEKVNLRVLPSFSGFWLSDEAILKHEPHCCTLQIDKLMQANTQT